ADYTAAAANVQEAKAALQAAEAEVLAAEANIQSAKAQISRVQADIDDSLLVSPLEGRIQYRIAEPGEVLNAGGRVLNLVDLTDVYMTFFLPERIAGKVKIGAPARIVLDAIPDTPIPATISFVSSVAQFTPKTVETKIERQKLMFRIKAKIAPELLKKYIDYVKTGLPGEAWVQINPEAKWPEFLKLKSERKSEK
ncbi:MAG: HlyD family efflux transporter periplasmic adaptor subunit, partial [Lentisphaeria bacterium]|nr:HlyD family efflux transporter periplasmic adaptor subunit [Lentisphaeria bacterium]